MNTIHMTRSDAEKILALLREAGRTDYRDSAYIRKLRDELERAEIVEPRQIAADVITMNSTARLFDVDTGEHLEYTLVYPEDADVPLGRISVLAPIGAAMLGYRVGDTFTWETPGGMRSLQVERILLQPEAGGDYS